nr:glycosyl hydrolase [uncultured Allomuricauda sp.]
MLSNLTISKRLLLPILLIGLASCKSLYDDNYTKPVLVDKKPTRTVNELHKKLFISSKKGILLGHQDSPGYGIGWKYDNMSKKIESDVQKTTGDFPGVYGFDLGHIELGKGHNLDTLSFAAIRDIIIDVHSKGGVITMSWHLDNPVSNGDSWDTSPSVNSLLYKKEYVEKYERWIALVADFITSLKFKSKKIPVILRPYHEMNGDWFWWGDASCSTTDYIALWKKTVHLLRDKHNLHQILYAYSPNIVDSEETYLKYYPGDEYVDILGVDIYDHNNSEAYVEHVQTNLQILKKVAVEKNKLFAFTETGFEKIPNNIWFTELLYPQIQSSGIAWILFWRNANKTHHYVPYPGHQSEQDFARFSNFPDILLLENLQAINTY